MRRTKAERAALKLPPLKANVHYARVTELIEEAFVEAQLKPGSLILPKLKLEKNLQPRTRDKLARQRAFLELIREGKTTGEALRALQITHVALNHWRKEDNYFAVAEGYAKEERTDLVERSLRHAAITGPKYIVASGGKLIGYNQVPDVKAQIALLKAERPEKFGDKQEISLTGHVEFSRPERAAVLDQVKRIMSEAIDIPALPAAPEVIDADVVDHAESDSTSDEDLQ
jgi:hypothetical protein